MLSAYAVHEQHLESNNVINTDKEINTQIYIYILYLYLYIQELYIRLYICIHIWFRNEKRKEIKQVKHHLEQ